MPDEPIEQAVDTATAEVAEQDASAKFDAGLAEAFGAEPDKETEPVEAAKPEADSEEPAGEEPAKTEASAEADAASELLKKAEALEKGAQAPAAEKPGEAPAPVQERPAESPAPGKMTKEDAKAYLDFFGDILPDQEFTIGDKELNFKQLEEDLPGISDAMRIASGRAAVKYVDHLAKEGRILTGAAVDGFIEKTIKPMQEKIEDLIFWDAVAVHDPEARSIANGQEFKGWLSKQPGPVQRMAKQIDSPQDALDFVKAFREDRAKTAAIEHDKKSKKALGRQQDLHGHSASPSRKPAANAPADEKTEYLNGIADAFNK